MRISFILFLILLLGFKPIIHEHGYLSLDIKLWSEIKLGDSKSKVMNILGSPTFISKNDDESWYYISQKIKQYRFFQKKKYSSQSLKVSFNEDNIVNDINHINVPERRIISINKHSTPISGINDSFMRKHKN